MLRIFPAGQLTRRPFLSVLVLALLVRGLFLAWTWTGTTAEYESALIDRYFAQGYLLSAGHGYLAGESEAARRYESDLLRRVREDDVRVTADYLGPIPAEGWRPEALHPPGMAILVAASNRLLGIRADEPIQILGLLLDSLAAAIVGWLATQFLGQRIGWLAGVFYAVFPPAAFAAISRAPDGMMALSIAGAQACLLLSVRTRRWSAAGYSALSGLLVGIGSYLRPDYMMLLPFMFVALWAYTRGFRASAWRVAVAHGVVLIVLLPWAWRNHELAGRWVFTSSAVGPTLITGLAEFTNPWGFRFTDEDRLRQASEAGITDVWSFEADQYFRTLFIESVRERPAAFLAAVAKRTPVLLATPFSWGFENPWKTRTFSESRDAGKDRYQVILERPLYVFAAYWDHLLMAALSLTCTISAVVLALARRREWGSVALLLSPHAYAILSHSVTHAQPRYLLPSFYCWLVPLAYVALSARWPCTRGDPLRRVP